MTKYTVLWCEVNGARMHADGCRDILRDARRYGGHAETFEAETPHAAAFDAIRSAYPDEGEISSERIRTEIVQPASGGWLTILPCVGPRGEVLR